MDFEVFCFLFRISNFGRILEKQKLLKKGKNYGMKGNWRFHKKVRPNSK